MNLLDTIKTDLITAKKAKAANTVTSLSTLWAESAIIGKNKGNRITTDAEVIQLVKKTIKNNEDTIATLNEHGDRSLDALKLTTENTLYETYLPQQLTEDELRTIIGGLELPEGKQAIGVMMKHLKANHDGCFDPRLAQQILASL